MEVHFTARRFRADPDMKERAIESVKKLDKYFDGIRRCDIILSFGRATNSVKTAELNLHVNRTTLVAVESSGDFSKSIDAALEKLGRRLETYKSKLRAKDRKKVRQVRSKAV
jgi:ribosomal subunit interface protein